MTTNKTQPDGPSPGGGAHVELLRADQVKIEPVQWLWVNWLALGKLHILAGEPSAGKTTIALAMATTITRGECWPDRTHCASGDVLIWSGEDDPSDTLVPRLKAMGADLERVQFVASVRDGDSRRSFDPAKDIDKLRIRIGDIPALRLLIIDPIVNVVSGDSHKNAEVRRDMAPLVNLAAQAGFAVLGITHFTKGTSGRNPVERVTGSLAFGALARVVLIAAKQHGQPRDARILARAKSNYGPEVGGFGYEIEQVDIDGGVRTSRLLWGTAMDGTARELLAEAEATAENESAIEQAADWLKALLAGGPVESAEVKRQSKLNGFSWASVNRAKKTIRVRVKKNGMKGPWEWSLPNQPRAAEDANLEDLNAFEHHEHLRAEDDAEQEAI